MSEKIEGLVIQYNVTDGAIAEIAEKFKDAEADTAAGYINVVSGIRCTRELRVEVESRRKELKSDALVYGRRVDAEAKRITSDLLKVEEPLKLLKSTVDDEMIEREAKEKREFEVVQRRRELDAENAERLRKQEAEDKERREKREKEDRERAEKQRIEDADREHRRRELEALENERLAREKAEKEAEEKLLEEERIETERAELEQRRKAALLDVEKLKAYTGALLDMKPPDLVTPSGNAVKSAIDQKLLQAQKLVIEFAEDMAPA